MNFYEIGPRQDFAGYWPEKTDGAISDSRIVADYRQVEPLLREYLGEPPRKPGKRGDLHKSARSFFLRPAALKLFESAARGKLETSPTTIIDRESESFTQVWVLNFVDCLDVQKTAASPSGGIHKGKIGVIRRPAFDESRWDGSDLFVVPQDPSTCFFCTENFVAQWKAARLKGAQFSRYLMDPEPIRC